MTGKKQLSFFNRLVLGFNTLLCLALLLSYMAPYINPHTNSYIAFFGLAYPPLLAANLLLIIYWLFFKARFALLSLLMVLAGWSSLNNHFGFHAAKHPAARDSGSIRIMTYNVHEFKRYGLGNDSWTRHDILSIINTQQPDVIGIQEYYSRKKGQYNISDSIKAILNTQQCYIVPIRANTAREAMGMAIFSKFPIVNQGFIQLSENGNENQCIYIDVKRGARMFRVYSIHLESIHFDADDYQYLDSVKQQGETNVHSFRRICGKLKRAFIRRSEQVTLIKESADKCPYPYLIAGDFNDTPSSYAVHQISLGMINAFRQCGHGLGRTYNGDFPNYQIDYIMTSPQFQVMNYQVIEKKLSDHYPVYSDLFLGK